MAKQLIHNSAVGLMQEKQIGRRDWDGPVAEVSHAAAIKKDTWENANYTIKWLHNQTDYNMNTRVYKNALFGYNPKNPQFQKVVAEFWDEYSKEKGSWRDQPYWAYFLKRHGMKPLNFPVGIQMGARGTMGHNGHTYQGTINTNNNAHDSSIIINTNVTIRKAISFEPKWSQWVQTHYMNQENPAIFTLVSNKLLVKDWIASVNRKNNLGIKVAKT
jgi:hypothetical protein